MLTSDRTTLLPAARPAGIGVVVSTKGSSATLRLRVGGGEAERATVGRFVAIAVGGRSLVGAVTELTAEPSPAHGGPGDRAYAALAALELVGEISRDEAGRPLFRRGVGSYPAIGDVADLISGADLRLIYTSSSRQAIEIGTLQQDSTIAACVNVDDLLSRHFAVLGTTGVGKSSGVAVLLDGILAARPDLRVFLLDGHNEYARCFGDKAQVLGAHDLRLPFWMFNFEETIDVVYGGRPPVAEEIEILAELIPLAKTAYGQYKSAQDRPSLKRTDPRSIGVTVDTPVPYMIQDLLALVDERMGRLENRSSRLHYHRLIARIDTIRNDPRYAFMFENAHVGGDVMGEIISRLFQLEPGGRPMTVMQLAGLPTEVVDAVVCVLCRMAFEFGLWSEGAVPLLFVCEEAHRYASSDPSVGFMPTRRALSRIAKEGRKHGVFLGLVTQRPAELDATIISQCSTLFVMRMANERDQALLRSAVPDAAANLLAFVPSLGTREVIGFGDGVSLPARMTFRQLPPDRLPRSDVAGSGRSPVVADRDFVATVIERWRGATMNAKQPPAGEPGRRDAAGPGAPAQTRQAFALDQIRHRLLRPGPPGEDASPVAVGDGEPAPAARQL